MQILHHTGRRCMRFLFSSFLWDEEVGLYISKRPMGSTVILSLMYKGEQGLKYK